MWVLSGVGEDMSGLCVEIGTLCENALRLLDRNWQTRGSFDCVTGSLSRTSCCAEDDRGLVGECPRYTYLFFSVFFSTLAQVSFSATVRLNTGLPGAES